MASTLVLGYDGSDCAKAALQAAVDTAQAFGDRIVVAFGAGVYPIGEDSDHLRLVRKMGADWADEALAAIRTAGVTDAEATVVDARPAEALLKVAADRSARDDRGGHARRAPPHRGRAGVGAAQAAAPLPRAGARRARARLAAQGRNRLQRS